MTSNVTRPGVKLASNDSSRWELRLVVAIVAVVLPVAQDVSISRSVDTRKKMVWSGKRGSVFVGAIFAFSWSG